MRLALALLVLVIATGHASAAAQFPAAYQGVWTTTGSGAESGAGAPQCKAADFDEHINDGLVSIAKASVKYWESGCDLTSLSLTNTGTVNLALSCGGEGETYKTRETWTIQKLRGADILVMTIPSRSSIALYTRCQ